jgi:hypothetical protein
MQHEDFSVDREESISKNVDATGKKWHIVPVRGLSLYEISAMDDRVTIPDRISGRWTKAEWLQDELDQYLKDTWDLADAKGKIVEREKQAKKEEKKKNH